jgi:hypothetical protein
MTRGRIDIGEEIGQKKAFVWALDWPGWCRAGRDPVAAREALVAAAPRFALVAKQAGLDFPDVTSDALETVVSVPGSGGTDFGVPGQVADPDRLKVSANEAERLAALVEAAWFVLDRVVAHAPPELRKGPRGGGRNRDKVRAHVVEADDAYAREIGIRQRAPAPDDPTAVAAARNEVLELLRRPSDGSPLNDRKWPARYAARRIAWHALDHAWEIEDRTEPA